MFNKVHAPFAGTVTQVLVESGEVVRKGQPLFKITPDEKIVDEDPADQQSDSATPPRPTRDRSSDRRDTQLQMFWARMGGARQDAARFRGAGLQLDPIVAWPPARAGAEHGGRHVSARHHQIPVDDVDPRPALLPTLQEDLPLSSKMRSDTGPAS